MTPEAISVYNRDEKMNPAEMTCPDADDLHKAFNAFLDVARPIIAKYEAGLRPGASAEEISTAHVIGCVLLKIHEKMENIAEGKYRVLTFPPDDEHDDPESYLVDLADIEAVEKEIN